MKWVSRFAAAGLMVVCAVTYAQQEASSPEPGGRAPGEAGVGAARQWAGPRLERLGGRSGPLEGSTLGAFGARASAPSAVAAPALTVDGPIFYQGVSFLHRSGHSNTALGEEALDALSWGGFNTALGRYALTSNTSGSGNTAVGSGALRYNDDASGNTAVGDYALWKNQAGVENTAVGQYALKESIGYYQGYPYPPYASNTAVGYSAARNTTIGFANVAVGARSLEANSNGYENTAIGTGALRSVTHSFANIALGFDAGSAVTAGGYNILIGHGGYATEWGTIRVGNSNQSRAFVSGIFGTTTGVADAVGVVVDSAGQLGTTPSSRRYKDEIRDMAEASEPLMELRPVTFRYKQDFAGVERPLQFGLVAEEVAAVLPELVVHDAQGRPQMVKYRLLSVMLLNEVQRLRREVEELRAGASNAGAPG